MDYYYQSEKLDRFTEKDNEIFLKWKEIAKDNKSRLLKWKEIEKDNDRRC